MYAVAILEPAAAPRTGVEDLATAIGGMTVLELRMALSGMAPSVLVRTPSRERAEETARVLSAAGHRAEAVDLAGLTRVHQMVRVHRFALDETSLRADAHGPTMAFDDIAVIIRIAAETSVLRTTREKDSEPSRGGRRTEVDVERTRTERAVEQAAFLFGPPDLPPWVLRAGEVRYLGLGAALRSTTALNFKALLAIVRSRATRAAYDERFATHPIARYAQDHVRDHDTASPDLADEAVELRVHLLARLLRESRTEGPSR